MKNYELVCILDPQVGEAQFEEIITRYEARLKEGGSEEITIDRWGLRKLAYTSVALRRRQQGYYVLFQFGAPASFLPALEEELKLEEGVMRYLIIAVDGEFMRVPQLAADNIYLEDPRGPRRGRPGGRDGRDGRDGRRPEPAVAEPAADAALEAEEEADAPAEA